MSAADPDAILAATRAAVEKLGRLENTFYGRADAELYELVLRFAEELLLRRPAHEPPSADALELLVECLGNPTDFLGEWLFDQADTDPQRAIPPAFREARVAANQKLRDSGAIHLELGTFSAFPDDVVAHNVQAMGLADFIRLDFDTEYRPDVAASCTALPFKDSSLDRVSSNSLFEHVAHPHEIIREAFRVLRPGGVLFTNVPFLFPYHVCPKDYLRFTAQFFEDICRESGFETITCDTSSTGGVYYVLHQLSKGNRVKDSAPAPLRAMLEDVHTAVSLLLALLQPLDAHFFSQNIWHGTLSLAVKPGEFRPQARSVDRSLPFVERHREILACPQTGQGLRLVGDRLLTEDSKLHYPIVDGVPDLVVPAGRWSYSSIRKRLAAAEEENRELRRRLGGHRPGSFGTRRGFR